MHMYLQQFQIVEASKTAIKIQKRCRILYFRSDNDIIMWVLPCYLRLLDSELSFNNGATMDDLFGE